LPTASRRTSEDPFSRRALETVRSDYRRGQRRVAAVGHRYGELIRVLDKSDRNSDAYRYPVNPDGERHDRPPYIELVALERHVSSFVSMIDGYTDYSDEARRYEMEMRAQFEQEMREVYGEDPFGQL